MDHDSQDDSFAVCMLVSWIPFPYDTATTTTITTTNKITKKKTFRLA